VEGAGGEGRVAVGHALAQGIGGVRSGAGRGEDGKGVEWRVKALGWKVRVEDKNVSGWSGRGESKRYLLRSWNGYHQNLYLIKVEYRVYSNLRLFQIMLNVL
jgi:hypothetical protein